jgi:anti-anti-sigma factor
MPLTTAAFCLSPQGPLVADTVASFAAHARAALAAGAEALVVDLEEVTTLDRHALEVLLDIAGELHQGGGSLALAAPNGLCADILRISRVDQAIPVLPSLADLD